MSSFKEWLETNIQQKLIYCCPESELKIDPTPIKHGGFGVVYKAKIKRRNGIMKLIKTTLGKSPNIYSGKIVAMKTLYNSNNCKKDLYQLLVKELKLHQRANNHPNIIRFLGLYKDKQNEYHMLFKLADGGNLRDYLKIHFENLTWKAKYKLGLEITNGLKYLHELGIVHKDLSSGNILIKSGVAKITDFGLSSVLKQSMSKSYGDGTPAYRDPLSMTEAPYRRGKKLDIFSLGVILWEISSGQIPCEGRTETVDIIVYRLKGSHDPPFPGTPEDYINLYSACWHEDASKRPSCETVHKRLIYYDKMNDLNESLETEPKNARALRERGEVYRCLRQYKNSLEDLNRSLDIKPNDARALRIRGAVYRGLKQYVESLNDFNKSLRLEPNDAWTLRERGNVYRYLKQYANSLSNLSSSLEIEPNNAWALKIRGAVYRDLKKYVESLNDFNKSLKFEPNDVWALRERGEVYRCLKQYGNSLNDFDKALEIEPNDPWALSGRGDVYRCLKQYDSSLNDFNKALEIEPNDAWALSMQANVYRFLELYDDALKNLKLALEIDQNYVLALSVRGNVYNSLKQYNYALCDVNKALEFEPNNTDALSIRGSIYCNLAQYDNALNDLNKSLEINPNYKCALKNRSETYYKLKQYDNALIDLNKSLEIDPDYVDALTVRGNVYYSREQHDNSLNDLNKASAIKLRVLEMRDNVSNNIVQRSTPTNEQNVEIETAVQTA